MIFNVIPDYDIDNSRVNSLLTNLNNYKNLAKRIKFNGFKTDNVIEVIEQDHFAYEIYLTRESIKFNFIFPDEYKDSFKNELNVCWPYATFKEEAEYINSFNINKALELELAQHYFLSIKTDRRGGALFPLPAILEGSRTLKEGEAAIIQFIFEPQPQDWNLDQEAAIKDFNLGKLPKRIKFDKNRIAPVAAKLAYAGIKETLSLFQYILLSEEELKDFPSLDQLENQKLFRNGLSINTQRKANFSAYDTSIRIAIQSSDRERQGYLLDTFKRSFNDLKEDNYFIPRALKDKELFEAIKQRRRISKVNKDILSTQELNQLIQMPTKHYQEEYNIKNISLYEMPIPGELKGGGIRLGLAKYKGVEFITYWNNSYKVLCMPKIVMGPMGSGKTEYVINFIYDAWKRGDGVILFDYIKNCEVSEALKRHINSNIVEYDISDIKNAVRLAYDEITFNEDPAIREKNANLQADLLAYIINSLREETTQELSGRMKKYLYAAAMVVFIHPGESIKSVQYVLTSELYRALYIQRAIESGIFKEDSIEIMDLKALDETDKSGHITGTKEAKIEGIIDRLNILQRNIYLRNMLEGKISINFADLIENKRIVLIKMPQSEFPNPEIKDAIVTFFMSKIRLATLILGRKYEKPPVCHVVTDEIHQVPTAAKLLADYITEYRKFGVSLLFTVHYLNQFRNLMQSVVNAGCSYMILAGNKKENISMLEKDIIPYTMDQALKLEKYTSLNVINNDNENFVFVSKLPKPL